MRFDSHNYDPAHVLIIAQSIEPFLPIIDELKEKQITLGVCETLEQGLKYIAVQSPQIVMISFNHTDTAVKESVKILERRFGVQCVAFCEKKAKNTAKILMQSGLKHLLFPPITADAIFDKVSRMIRDQNRNKPKKSKISIGSELPENKKSLFEDVSARPGNVQNLFASAPPKIERVHNLTDEQVKNKKDVAKEEKSWFETYIIPFISSLNTDFSSREISGLPVKTKNFAGLILFRHTESLRVLEKLSKELKAKMSNLGESCYCGEPFRLNFTDIELARVSSIASDQRDGVSIIELSPDEPKTKTSVDRKILTISMDDIDLSSALTFNLYIYLPRNKKYYLFARRGRLISAKRIQRLNTTDHELFIQKAELGEFRSYFFKNTLLKLSLTKKIKAS